MIPAVTAWIAAALICFVFMRRIVFNFGDPLVFVNVSIPFSAALLAFLCSENQISWDKLGLFFLVLTFYLIGGRISAAFFSRDIFRRAIIKSVNRLSKAEIYVLLALTTLITLLLAYFAVLAGAQGDARQEFSRAFRPLVTLHSGLWLIALLALLSPVLSRKEVFFWFALLVTPSIAFSGKAILLPIFFWFGLRFFVLSKQASFTAIAALVMAVFVGVSIMGLLAYGAESSAAVLLLIVGRLWLSGDVYIYAYQRDALAMTRHDYHVSFLSYMLHPVTSLFGLRGYEKPLGSMLASETLESDVLTGPNPQLPVLLDYFFPADLPMTVILALLVGIGVIAIRVVGIRLNESRSRYLALGGVAAAVFAPQAGFADTSLVTISVVGIIVATGCCGFVELVAQPFLRRRRNLANGHELSNGFVSPRYGE